MRRIEIELDGVVVTARLLDDKAPKLCQAIWDVLPIDEMAAHAQWSGAMFRTTKNKWLDFKVDYPQALENRGGFQAPGDVVFYPPAKELAIAYGEAQFSWVTGNSIVSTIAVIEDDLSELTKKAEQLQFNAAKMMSVRALDENKKTVEIKFEGLTLTAELWPDKAPELVKAIWKALPLEGKVTNTYWSGQMARLWTDIPGTEGMSENVTFLPHPGDILFVPGWNGLRFVYGQAQMRGPGGPHAVPKVGKVHGDISAFAAKAQQIQFDGGRKFVIRRKE